MIGIVVNGCHDLTTESTQVFNIEDKQSFDFDWLPNVLRSELLISEKDLLTKYQKSEHRKLLTDTEMDDKQCDRVQTDEDVRCHSPADPSVKLSPTAESLQWTKSREHLDVQVPCSQFETVIRPPENVSSGRNRGRLRCQISRTNSVTDRSCTDDLSDSLLKTPAGFYDHSYASGSISIPPLFDYSSGMFLDTESTQLFSIVEDEKWSEGSEVSSADVDTSSISAPSPAEFLEDRVLSILEEEERLSDEEEGLVLSVVQNVLSDETAALSTDDSKEEDWCSDKCQLSPEVPSAEITSVETSTVVSSSCSLLPTADASKLNPLAQPFSFVPKAPLQPVPVVFTPTMPTIVFPVKYAYTSLVPVGQSKSSSKQLEKGKGKQFASPVPASQTLYSDRRLGSRRSVGPILSSYQNVGMYYYTPWQPVYCVGRPSYVPLMPIKQMTSSPATSASRHVKSRSKKEHVNQSEPRSLGSSQET